MVIIGKGWGELNSPLGRSRFFFGFFSGSCRVCEGQESRKEMYISKLGAVCALGRFSPFCKWTRRAHLHAPLGVTPLINPALGWGCAVRGRAAQVIFDYLRQFSGRTLLDWDADLL